METLFYSINLLVCLLLKNYTAVNNKFKSKVFNFLLKAFKSNDLNQIEKENPKSHSLKSSSYLEKEKPFSELLENVKLIAVFLDLNGKVTYCNSYLLTLTGYEQEELIGSDWFGLMIPDDNHQTKDEFLKGLKTGKIANHFENPILSKSGKQLNIFWNNTILKDNSGNVTGTASIGEDVTQRKFFEKALIKASENLEANEKVKSDLLIKMNEAQQNAKIGSWDWDMITNKVWWSDELYRIFELNPEDFIPNVESNARYVHPDDNIPYHSEVQRVIESREELNYDLRIITPSGKIKYCNSRAKLDFDVNDNPIRFHGTFSDITERKQAEENIQAERDFSNALLDGLPGIFYLYDNDFKFLRWNKNFETVSGYTGDEIAAMGPLDFFSGDQKDLLREKIGEVFTKGYAQVEADFLSKNGTQTPYFFNGLKIKFKNKDCLTGIGINIEDRKKAEAAVRESEERYRTIISNIPGGLIHIFDRNMRYVFNAGEELARLGLSNELLVGKSIHDVLPADVALMVEKQYKRVLAGETVRFEGGYGKDYFGLTSSPLRNADGEIENILTLSVNITERKQAEKALLQSEEKFNKAFFNSPDAITITRASDGKLIDVNDAFCKLSGFDRESVIGSSTILLNLWYDINDRVKYVNHLKEFGSIKDFESKFVTNKGVVRDFLISGEIFMLNNETCIIGILRDITDLKRTRDELDNLNKELEQRISERTFQLESANRELESFSYSISHDLRAPLRAIYGFSQILAGRHRESLNEEGKKYMDYILQSSIRMEQLINDLLNYSRLGRKTIDIRPVSLKKITDTVYDDFKSQIEEVDGKFVVEGNPREILSDESLLRQIFSNLIGNSIKYRPKDKALSIIINFESSGNNFIIKVTDNGIGIAAEHYEKIFNVFQRLHSEDKYPGTGIGLANVKKAVSMLGGTIEVESAVGKGSTFIIKFRQQKSKSNE